MPGETEVVEQKTEVVAAEPAAVEAKAKAEADAAAVKAAETEVEVKEPEPDPAITEALRKKDKEISRHVGTIQRLQAQLATRAEPEKVKAAPDKAPVGDLEPDEDGYVTHPIAGRIAPGFAAWMREQDEVKAAMQAALEQDGREQADRDVSEASTALWDSVETSIKDLRVTKFPKVKGADATLLDADLCEKADAYFSEHGKDGYTPDGKLDPAAMQDLIDRSVQYAFARATRLFGIHGVEQFLSNKKYAEEHKVAADALPGVPTPAEWDKLTPQQQREYSKRAARIAEQVGTPAT